MIKSRMKVFCSADPGGPLMRRRERTCCALNLASAGLSFRVNMIPSTRLASSSLWADAQANASSNILQNLTPRPPRATFHPPKTSQNSLLSLKGARSLKIGTLPRQNLLRLYLFKDLLIGSHLHFVLLFWNHVLICTSVRFKAFESSRRFETERYLSA